MSEFNLQKFLYLNAQKSIKDGIDLYGKNNETVDKIAVWLTGFSITIITLLIANLGKSNLILSQSGNLIIFFAFLTIFFGVVQRIVMVVFNKIQIDTILNFDQYVVGYTMPEDNKYSRYLSEYRNSVADLVKFLELDFGYVYDNPIPEKNSEEYKNLLHLLVTKYNELQDNRLLFEINLFNETLSKQIGYNIPKVTKIETKEKPHQRNIFKLLNFSNLLFYLMCSSFLLSILIPVITYLITTSNS